MIKLGFENSTLIPCAEAVEQVFGACGGNNLQATFYSRQPNVPQNLNETYTISKKSSAGKHISVREN